MGSSVEIEFDALTPASASAALGWPKVDLDITRPPNRPRRCIGIESVWSAVDAIENPTDDFEPEIFW